MDGMPEDVHPRYALIFRSDDIPWRLFEIGLLEHFVTCRGILSTFLYGYQKPSILRDTLYNDAGLLGLSGLSGDGKTLLKSDEPHSQEAISQFAYQARKLAGALIATMGGIDQLIFTGGVGEFAPSIRSAICNPLRDLYGIQLDARANELGEMLISAPDSSVIVEIVHTDEALIVAGSGHALLQALAGKALEG
jgi:acetate kinase